MARLMKRKDGRLVEVGKIPPEHVGKVTTAAELKAAKDAVARAKGAEAKAAEREAKKATPELPPEIADLAGEPLAERYESVLGRKPGNRKEDTQRAELVAALEGDEGEG